MDGSAEGLSFFLSFLMTALVAKIVAMGLTGVNIMPAVIIIPATALITITCTVLMFRSIRPQADPEVA
jgi:predicted signal transduction protein with EAL and GGDEF domain